MAETAREAGRKGRSEGGREKRAMKEGSTERQGEGRRMREAGRQRRVGGRQRGCVSGRGKDLIPRVKSWNMTVSFLCI